MVSKGQSGTIVGLVLFVSFFFVGFFYVENTATDSDLSIDQNLTDTTVYEVRSDWLSSSVAKDNGTYLNVENTDMFIEPNESDTWISNDIDVSGVKYGDPIRFDYYAEPNGGNLTAKIRSFNSTDDLIATETIELNQSYDKKDLGIDEVETDHLDVVLEFEDGGLEDKEPRIQSYSLEVYNNTYPERVGLTSSIMYILTMIVFGITGLLVVGRAIE